MENYYKILQVSEKASSLEIKMAFKRLALRHHPDLHPQDATQEEKFKQINEAYQTLSDAQKKAYYDMHLNAQLYRKATSVQTDLYRQGHQKEGTVLSQKVKRTAHFASAVFFISFIAFAVYFHGFMNRLTARVHLQDAIASWQSGQTILAFAEIQQALSFDKTLAEAYFLKARIYAEEYQNYHKAIVEWDKGLKYTSKQNADLWLQRAEWNRNAQNYRNTIIDYTKAINFQSMNGKLYFERALVKIQLANEQGRLPSNVCNDFKMAVKLGKSEALTYITAYCNSMDSKDKK